ncbi:hypothetical protein LJR257_006786 [Ensifer adhaerens]
MRTQIFIPLLGKSLSKGKPPDDIRSLREGMCAVMKNTGFHFDSLGGFDRLRFALGDVLANSRDLPLHDVEHDLDVFLLGEWPVIFG